MYLFTLTPDGWKARVFWRDLSEFKTFLDDAVLFYEGCEYVYEERGFDRGFCPIPGPILKAFEE